MKTPYMSKRFPANTTFSDRHEFECVHFDDKCEKAGGCATVTACERPEDPDQIRACFAVFVNENPGKWDPKVQKKLCIPVQHRPPYKSTECLDQKRCIASSHGQNPPEYNATFTCCCHTSMCNDDIWPPLPPTPKPPPTGSAMTPTANNDTALTLVYTLVPICFLTLLVTIGYWVYRRYSMKKTKANRNSNGDVKAPFIMKEFSSTGLEKRLKLEKVVAHGRYGSICRAILDDKETVAIKVFPSQMHDSWMKEQEIYKTPRMNENPNILQLIAAEVRIKGPQTEYWLITTYHPHGSLYDFLKARKLNLAESLRLATTMLHGLSFLHEEYSNESMPQSNKPCIVHRDFKSKNVLVKNDLTACIADFGLALQCVHGNPRRSDDYQQQVGTRRYMAPEVLQGAQDFNAFAFRQIDVYACALVLWELFSRCALNDEPAGDHKLPFEEEVGNKPSFEALVELVSQKKKRPAGFMIKDSWRNDPKGSVICNVIEEMWEMEHEARISAGVAHERLLALIDDHDESIISSEPSTEFSTISNDRIPLMSDYHSNPTVAVGPMRPPSPAAPVITIGPNGVVASGPYATKCPVQLIESV